MIELKNISVRYGPRTVVDDVSATVSPGDFIALVGPNGSGKSSLLKAIAGLLPHDGTTTLPTNPRERAKRLSYLGQNSTAPDGRKVKEIIALGRTPFLGPFAALGDADHQAIKTAAEACETSALFNQTFGDISGGEQMRVHLSRALATGAPLLIADEPITALDPYYQISTLNILRRNAEAGTTVIIALHDLQLAARFADRIWVMQSGRLVADGPGDTTLSEAVLRDVFRITLSGQIII